MINKITLFVIILTPSICFAGDFYFDHYDKVLFTGLCVVQVYDGLTTGAGLDRGERISETWSWKYGTDRPSPARLWGVKVAELGLAYLVAKNLHSPYRKAFLIGTTVLLTYYGTSNGLEFKINF